MEFGYRQKPVEYYGNVNPNMLAMLPRKHGMRVLDVGCGTGNLARLLKEEDESVFVAGIELHEAAACEARGAVDDLWQEDYETWVPPETYLDSFDHIIFADVLEHLVDPEQAVAKAASLLSPQGSVIAVIPNVRWLPVVWSLVVRGQWEYCERGVLDQTHLRFFTKSSMRSLFEGQGLVVEEWLPIFHHDSEFVRRTLGALATRFDFFEQFYATQYALRARLEDEATR